MKKIAVIGLNPAWQKSLFFERLQFDEVNRAIKVEAYASGKGINFCRAARGHGIASTLLFELVGGSTGKMICDELDSEGFSHESIVKDYPTRTCSTCLCANSSGMTELIEPAGSVGEKYFDELMERLECRIDEIDGVAICGTAPDGAAKFKCYERIARKAMEHKLPMLIDSYRNLGDTLKYGVSILKVNTYELGEISGKKNVVEAMKYCFAQYNLRCIVATDGKKGAYLSDGHDVRRFVLPELGKIVSPLGAGDTASAVLFSEFLNSGGEDLTGALTKALSAASASCLTGRCAEYDEHEAKRIAKKISIQTIICGV